MTNEPKNEAGPVYLGDSVYARERLGQVELYTDNGLGRENRIVLDPEVFDALANFASSVFDR
jgi:hypothetical protein